MKDVAQVLNLEARGSGGTVLMYETSHDNAWVIQEYARAAVAPLTGSVATDVWRLMPNSSDLTVFLQNGKQGMNFAFGENWTAYHTTQDSVENLDPGSLQHHGANALALAKHFAGLDLTTPPTEDAIFFSVLRLGVIHYPKGWTLPLMIAALLAYLLVLIYGLQSNSLSLRGIGLGIAAFLCASAAAAIFGYLGVKALDLLKGGELIAGMGGTYNAHWYELGMLLVFLPITASIYAVFQRKNNPESLAIGALLFWLVLTIASSFLLAGASYLFTWPLITGLLVLGAYLRVKKSGTIFPWTILLLPVMVGIVLVGTVLYLVQLMFGVGILPASGFLTVLILSLAFPYLEFMHLPRPSAWAVIPSVIGGLIIVTTALITRTQADQPRQNFIFYSMNADSGQARWVAEAQLPDPTLMPLLGQAPREGFLSDYFPTSMQKSVWIQDAAPIDSIPPELRVMEDSTNGSQRTLRLNLSSPRGASAIMAEVAAKDAILSATLYGEQFNRGEPRSSVFFKGDRPSRQWCGSGLNLAGRCANYDQTGGCQSWPAVNLGSTDRNRIWHAQRIWRRAWHRFNDAHSPRVPDPIIFSRVFTVIRLFCKMWRKDHILQKIKFPIRRSLHLLGCRIWLTSCNSSADSAQSAAFTFCLT